MWNLCNVLNAILVIQNNVFWLKKLFFTNIYITKSCLNVSMPGAPCILFYHFTKLKFFFLLRVIYVWKRRVKSLWQEAALQTRVFAFSNLGDCQDFFVWLFWSLIILSEINLTKIMKEHLLLRVNMVVRLFWQLWWFWSEQNFKKRSFGDPDIAWITS